jgi:hypothetical protein
MFESLLGVRLVLLTGTTVPLPASAEVMRALKRVEVTSDADQGDGFQITFSLAKGALMDYTLLQSGAVAPFTRVVIAVAFGVVPEVLIDGVVTHHQLAPSNEPGQSTLTVTGRDVSLMLDLEEKNEPYPNQPDWLVVGQRLAAYAQYGIVPAPTPTADVPIELERITRQHETDLRFIQRLAERNGYVFYIEPVTLGVNTAYWGPENRLGLPQRALSVDLGPATNVKALNFATDALAPVETEGVLVEPITKAAIPIPPLPPLRVPPLARTPLPARRKVLMREAANRSPAQAAATAVSTSTRAPDPVTATGEVDNVRYAGILRARRLVGVRGAGLSYDGFYYVRRVTHTLGPGHYRQSFTLSREGTGTLTPVVVP